MTPTEISRALGVNVTTLYHLTNTLEGEGFLQRDRWRRLRLGPAIGVLDDAFESVLHPDERLVEFLEQLNRRTGETSYLGAWDGDDVTSVAVREGRGGVSVRAVHLGYRDHAYARALGRALLAYRDKAFIDEYLSSTVLETKTVSTVTRPDALCQILAEVREAGVAVDREEFIAGVCCAASPIFDAAGSAVASLTVSVPKARFDAEEEMLIEAVRETAAAASAAIQSSEERRVVSSAIAR